MHRTALAVDLRTVHVPEIDLPAVVAPQDIASLVGVEIVSLDDDVVGELGAPTRQAADIAAGIVPDVEGPRRVVVPGATESCSEGASAIVCRMIDDDTGSEPPVAGIFGCSIVGRFVRACGDRQRRGIRQQRCTGIADCEVGVDDVGAAPGI
jgi:hypothetical protein